MASASFFGATLEGKESVSEWKVTQTNDEKWVQEQKLTIKQILLGAEAAGDEFNVVEANLVKDSTKIPIAVLKAGETRALYPNIEFCDSVTFKLIKGAGPVYIHGVLEKEGVEVVDWEEDESDEDDGEEEEDDEVQPKKKQKIENNSDGKNAKHKKK